MRRCQARLRSSSGRAHRLDPDKGHTAEDEGVDSRRQISPADEATSSHATSVPGLTQHVGESRSTDHVHARRKSFRARSAPRGVGQFGPVQHLGGAELAEIALVLGAAGHCRDVVAETRQQSHRETADSSGRSCHHDRTLS